MALFSLIVPPWLNTVLARLAVAIDDHALEVRLHRKKVIDQTDAIRENTNAIHHHARAVNRLTSALTPKPATSFTFTTEPEPEGSHLKESTQMDVKTYPPGGPGFKALLVFNGRIDEPPQLALTEGSPGSFTQDPAVEEPDDTRPGQVKTTVVCHFDSEETGIVGITGSVKADELTTPEEDRVVIEVPTLAVFAIPVAKATAFSIETEAEADES